MGNCVECCREDQGDEACHVYSVQDVIYGADEGCFCAVVGSEALLCGVAELVVAEVVGEASVDEFL